MRIVIDLQGAQAANKFRGIGRYARELAVALVKQCSNHEVLLALNGSFAESVDEIQEIFAGLLPKEHIVVWSTPQGVAGGHANWELRKWAEIGRERFLANLNPDWVIITSLFEGYCDDAVTSISGQAVYRTAVVLHDLIPLIRADFYLSSKSYRLWYFDKIDQLRRADLLLANSNSSKQEAIDCLNFIPEKITVISAGVDSKFKPVVVDERDLHRLRTQYGLRRSYMMYVAGGDPRKNVEGLLKAYNHLPQTIRSNYQLVVVGAMGYEEKGKLFAAMDVGGLGDELVVTDFVSDADLLLLYNSCALCLFPSLHEGFGLPVLEAMCCGRPVLASNRTSLPEILGCEEALFDPDNLHDMTTKIYRGLTDDDFRQRLIEHGLKRAQQFSWEESARRVWAVIAPKEELVPQCRERKRLAVISPLPPDASGIADYCAELIRYLTYWYQVDVVLREPAVLQDDYVRANCGVISVATFRSQAERYERILYQFGNSSFHEHMFDLLDEFPGVVVLHDFFLSGIHADGELLLRRPGAWTRALSDSHGYHALIERYSKPNMAEVIYQYPANLGVLQQALGVVVHSWHSCQLAELWYGQGAAANWKVIPLLRERVLGISRQSARMRLNIAADVLVICSFGIVNATKLNHRLLEAWLASRLAEDEKVQLIFVGQNSGSYAEEIQRRICGSSSAARIRITGWVDSAGYRDWLAAADIAVQLRTLSRGETSGAVLDCMNFGIATIVNAHGAMQELDPTAVWMLPDEFSTAQLVVVLEELAYNKIIRSRMGESARAIVQERHNPRICAEHHYRAIEDFYTKKQKGCWGIVHSQHEAADDIMVPVAAHLAVNHPPQPRLRQLLVDISELVQRDVRTGIQRVVRAILGAWLRNPPAGFVVEPVYAIPDRGGYWYARRFTCQFLGIPQKWVEDRPIDAWEGDIFFLLDYQPTIQVAQRFFYRNLRQRRVKTVFLVYDLLPIKIPQYFLPAFDELFSRWLTVIGENDGAVCISKTVARELGIWMQENLSSESTRIDWFHIAADISATAPTTGCPGDASRILARLREGRSFLMVGTLEPRKGHAQVLDAFEKLWNSGVSVNLVMVGKAGWMVGKLLKRLKAHPERGKRLFWLEGISDEYLEQIYQASIVLIAASYGEGFGLPLIEAARHGLPIIARDLPIFREVAGDYVYYFSDSTDSEVIAQAILEWLTLWQQKLHPTSNNMPFYSWRESAAQLLGKILELTE